MPFLLLQLFGDRNAWSRLNTWEAKDAWRACFGRWLSASTIFSSDSAVQTCTYTWTLVARVFVSRIDGHWAQKSGHSGSCPRRQCPPSDSATWASPGAERAVTPISHAYSNLLIAPFFPVSPETTCAETPWARPSSARHSLSRVHLCLLPIL